ncbi:MAG: glycosyl hydrolase family 28 protein [Victivallaceae bacterium]|nr:glycosyl hydrolase family 28 protein [Victivallaceae bacterium]
MAIYNVQNFGAVGDGIHLDTTKIQSAIDHAAKLGGGIVLFPPGKYLSGTIVLRDNITLYIEKGSEIFGSGEMTDYISDESVSLVLRWHLIVGKNIKNVSIKGGGKIDGNSSLFREKEKDGQNLKFSLKPERPRMIFLLNTENVSIKDITLCDAPCYTIWLLGCENVLIDGIIIRSNRRHGTSDGIDIDCSKNVIISNCNINTGDDCIALKSDTHRLGRRASCENIVVTNCILSTRAAAVRIGFEGDGEQIRDCTFSNLVIYDTGRGFLFQSIAVPKFRPSKVTGVFIENIIISNIIMRNVTYPLFAITDKEQNGYIRQLSISDWRGEVGGGFYIGAYHKNDIEDIFLKNINLRISEKTVMTPFHTVKEAYRAHASSCLCLSPSCLATQQEEVDLFPTASAESRTFMPYGLAIRNIKDIRLSGFKIIPSPMTSKWKGNIRWHGVNALNIDGVDICKENGVFP